MAGSSLIGNLSILLSMDTAAFEKGNSHAQKALRQTQRQFEGMATKMVKVGATMSLAITTPLVAFATKSFDTAKDAQELQSAFDQTFGSMSESMNKWAEETGNAMSRSTKEIQQGAQTFGLYFNQAAKTREEAAKMSQTFTVLAQDMASFHNTSGEDAIAALRSGLSGESEPLRRFGVFLSEAAVQAKAAELGIEKLGGKLTDQQKVMARYALIMEATKNAQGDVARTSSSTANQIKASQAAWEELQITVGTKLLPVLTPLITALTSLLEKFNTLSPSTQTWVLGIAAVGAAIGPVLVGLGGLLSVVGSLLPLILKIVPAFQALVGVMTLARVAALGLLPALVPFLVPLGALAAAVGAVYLAWKNWDKIGPIVARMVNTVKGYLSTLGNVLASVLTPIRTVTNAFRSMYDKVVGNSYVPDMVDGIAAQMARLDAVMVAPVTAATAKSAQAFRDLQTQVSGLLNRLFPDAAALNTFRSEISTLEAAMQKGILTADQYAEALSRLQTEGLTDVPILEEPQGSLVPANDDVFGNIERGVDGVLDKVDQVRDRTQEWQNILSNVAIDLARMGGDILSGLVDKSLTLKEAFRGLLSYAIQFLTSSQGMTLLSGLFGGARAMGGPVVRGKTYLVGENGPELFSPGTSGQVISNDNLRGMSFAGGNSQTINVYTNDADSFRRNERQIARDAKRRLAQA